MGSRRLGQSRKRRRNINYGQSKNRKRSHVEPNDTTKIIDINNDCLEHIFKYLALIDLLNVADSSKCLKPTVDLVVSSRYRKMRVCLRNIRPSRKQSIEVSKLDWDVLITDLTTCLKFLRCFGHLIDSLHMDYHGCTRYHRVTVDQYVNEYCNKSLHDIFIQGASKWAMQYVQKPFSMVRFVRFKDCRLGDPLIDLNKWFPRMYSLIFYPGNQMTVQKCIKEQFSHLERLIVYDIDNWPVQNPRKNVYGPDNVAKVLRLTSQLKELCIPGEGFDAEFLQRNSKYLQSLEKLTIWYSNENRLRLGNDVIHFEKIKNLTIMLSPFLPVDEDSLMPRIPFSFDQLEEFVLYVSDVVVGSSFRDFIIQNPSMSKLILRLYCEDFDPLDENNKIALAKAAASLKQIDISGIQFSIEETIDFISECKSMTKFFFQLHEHLDYDDLKQRLDPEWNVSIDNNRFINLER